MCACLYVVFISYCFYFSLLPHGSMKLQGQTSYGGCRADIHDLRPSKVDTVTIVNSQEQYQILMDDTV